MPRVHVRGIYSTALTKILQDHDFEIVEPSVAIKERLKLRDTDAGLLPDLDVYDRLDRQGVYVLGEDNSLDVFISVLQSSLEDVVIRRRTLHHKIDYERFTNASTNLEQMNEHVEGTPPDSIQGSVNIEFPALSKKRLDAIRSLVAPTIEGHHYFKACGGRIESLLEMAERMLEKEAPRDEVERLFKETVAVEYPHLDSRVDIEHVKIDGRVFHLNYAKVVDFDEEKGSLRLLRIFKRSGTYDGLKIRKDPNDYALTDLKIGDWTYRTNYFSSDGLYKGTYINLNTPIELYPEKIRYVDLEVDVCLWHDGRMEKLDLDKLEETVSEGYISENLSNTVKQKLEEVVRSLSPEAQRYVD